MNYIKFFSVEVPNWMKASNQKAQEVGFNTDAYWQWVFQSINVICKKYDNNQLVMDQFGLLVNWLDDQAKGGTR